ncbi:MAG: putative membrane protein YfcA [Gammaproteobacteria bacterium]|jgi:uncharacterized membrane protein YfcA
MQAPLFIDLLLPLVLFTAALVQAAGGMGFGLIAGPGLVLALGGAAGIQATIMLNLIVALVTWLACHQEVRYAHVLPMVPGLLAGIGCGLGLSLVVPELAIKIALCIVLGWICFINTWVVQKAGSSLVKFSLLSGVMAGCLAIPGPAASVYLRGISQTAGAARSAMMPLLFFTYAVAGVGVVALHGLNEKALEMSTSYGPIATAGVFAGLWLSRWLSERTLSRITQGLLFGTFLTLTYATTVELFKFL